MDFFRIFLSFLSFLSYFLCFDLLPFGFINFSLYGKPLLLLFLNLLRATLYLLFYSLNFLRIYFGHLFILPIIKL